MATEEFGKTVLKALIEKNIKIKDIARGIGISDAEVSYIISGKRKSDVIKEKITKFIETQDDNCVVDEFEKRIRFLLIDNDMKVSELAKELNVSRAAAYYALTGRSGYDKIRERMLALLT